MSDKTTRDWQNYIMAQLNDIGYSLNNTKPDEIYARLGKLNLVDLGKLATHTSETVRLLFPEAQEEPE